ncbi:hypothetical protein BCR37DRAFT_383627, partial [Protomyces lactucae-debilis]
IENCSVSLNMTAGILRSSRPYRHAAQSLSTSKDTYCRSLCQFAVFLNELANLREQGSTRKEQQASCLSENGAYESRSILYG